ncbi:PAS domain S-box protein [Halobacteriaceae archaeon GCM10025711]
MGSGQATPIRVLHVDDDPAFLDLVAEYLERESEALTVVSATDPDEALAGLDDVDCVVSDYEMPRMDGLELLAEVRERHPDLPFILFTGVGSEHLASDAIAAGVTDYFRKENGPEQYAVLARRIISAVERRRAEREVRRREASLANAQRIASIGNWDWDLRTDDLRWSDEIYRLFGVEPGAFEETFQAFMRFVHPDDRSAVEEAVEEALAGSDGETYGVDHRIVRPDGEVRYVHEQGEVVVEDGTPVAMSGVVHDITERKEHEHALERYETIVEAVGDPVYALDPSGRFTFVNDAFVRVTGYTEDELVGEDVSMVLDPADVETAESLIRQLLADPGRSTATFELEVETTDGDRIHGENQMALLPFDDAFRGTAGVVRDITERKRIAAALEAERDRFRALFENIPDPTVDVEFVDGEPIVRAVNAAFEQVFGLDGAAAVGEHLDDLVVPGARRSRAEQISRRVRDEETAYDAEVRRQTTTGLRDFLLRIAPIDADGDRYYGIYTDITARKERERAITRQNERLEEFAKVVSHDVRNP